MPFTIAFAMDCHWNARRAICSLLQWLDSFAMKTANNDIV